MRYCELQIDYAGYNAASSIQDDLLSFEYDEKAAGDADSLTLTLHDKTRKWLFGWFPKKGDIIHPVLISHDWNAPGEIKTLDCGEMPIDEPQFSGPPPEFVINALSIPASDGFNDNTESYTWQNISLQALGQQIANKYGLQYAYDAPMDFVISALTQSNQTDFDLLKNTAGKYNICVKIYSSKLILYAKATYEARDPVRTIQYGESSISQYSLAAPTVDTDYAAVVETYSLPDNDTPFTYTFSVAGSGKTLTINESVDDDAQAEAVAKSSLRATNEKRKTGSFTLSLDLSIVAACTIQLDGWGNFDGKYFVDSAKHTYGGSGAGQTAIEVHECLEGGY